jgi:hypothetical protein
MQKAKVGGGSLAIGISVILLVFMQSSLVLAQTSQPAPSQQTTVVIASSGDDAGWFSVKPAVSLGFQWNFASTDYSLKARSTGIGGVTRREFDYGGAPSIYVDGRVPFTFGKRLEVAFSGSWATTGSSSDVRANDFFGGALLGGRTWDNAQTYWVTGNVQASYALIKDFHFLKAFAPIVGLRYDYGHSSFDDPHDVSPGFAAAAPADTADFNSEALLPYLGLTTTIGGLKTDWFGGDLKLTFIGGWTAWGRVRHEEDRNGGGSTRFDQFKGNLDSGSYFIEVGGEYTVVSIDLSRSMELSLSLFTKYDLFRANGKLDGVRTGTFSERDTFDFEMDRSAITGGITGALTF